MSQRLSKQKFLDQLTAQQAFLFRKGLGMSPELFWRAASGNEIVQLPEKMRYISEITLCQIPTKKQQLELFDSDN